jgi:hypothetical protein
MPPRQCLPHGRMLPELYWRLRRRDRVLPCSRAARRASPGPVVTGERRSAQASVPVLAFPRHDDNLTRQRSLVVLWPMVGAVPGVVIRPAYGRMSQSSWSMRSASRTLPSVTDPLRFAQPARPAVYSTDAASCRILRDDADPCHACGAAHRLVDRGRLRSLPRHRPEHLDGVRRSTAGARPRPDVWQVAGLATCDGAGLGKFPPAPGALTPNLFTICEYSSPAVQHGCCILRLSTALALYDTGDGLGEHR